MKYRRWTYWIPIIGLYPMFKTFSDYDTDDYLDVDWGILSFYHAIFIGIGVVFLVVLLANNK